MTAQFEHVSVLMDETIDALAIKPDGIYMDGTFGRGGHSGQILARLGDEGRLQAIDLKSLLMTHVLQLHTLAFQNFTK